MQWAAAIYPWLSCLGSLCSLVAMQFGLFQSFNQWVGPFSFMEGGQVWFQSFSLLELPMATFHLNNSKSLGMVQNKTGKGNMR